jgi:hypothetical protein
MPWALLVHQHVVLPISSGGVALISLKVAFFIDSSYTFAHHQTIYSKKARLKDGSGRRVVAIAKGTSNTPCKHRVE